jgi:hypothetical protein
VVGGPAAAVPEVGSKRLFVPQLSNNCLYRAIN